MRSLVTIDGNMADGGGGVNDGDIFNYTRRRSYGQRGGGIGSFFKGIFRAAVPLLVRGGKAVGKTVAKEALNAGVGILGDMATGRMPIKDSFREHARQSGKNLKRKAEEGLDRMSGSGYKSPYQTLISHSSFSSDGSNISKNINKRRRKKKVSNKQKKKKNNSSVKKRHTAKDIFEV